MITAALLLDSAIVFTAHNSEPFKIFDMSMIGATCSGLSLRDRASISQRNLAAGALALAGDM
jgi:hypothetical protein